MMTRNGEMIYPIAFGSTDNLFIDLFQYQLDAWIVTLHRHRTIPIQHFHLFVTIVTEMVTLPVTSVRIIHSVSYSVISQAVDVTRISISKTLESTPTVLHKINCDVNAIECRQFYE